MGSKTSVADHLRKIKGKIIIKFVSLKKGRFSGGFRGVGDFPAKNNPGFKTSDPKNILGVVLGAKN